MTLSRLPFFSSCCAVSMVLSGCSSPAPVRDAGPDGPGDAAAASWHTVLQGLKPALLCVWGTSAEDVFAVGGSRGNGQPTAAFHYDGHAWKDLAPGGTETFWWTHGTSGTDVWMVGESGRIAHWDGAAFAEHTSGTTATLYGVWAIAPNDVWAVGGTPEGGTQQPNDVILHFDGAHWTPSPPPQVLGRTFFKVWGTGADNLYVVGEAATGDSAAIWHRTGTSWTRESNPALTNLTTVAGCGASEVYAVGGRSVLRSDGAIWARVDVTLTNDVSGVACASPGNVVLVGSGGLKQRLVQGMWHDDFGAEPYNTELHGAWADPTGAYWAAGGDYISTPQPGATRLGVIGYFGTAIPSGRMGP
jgi:hypothetical protein